jgi:hypothetical protein
MKMLRLFLGIAFVLFFGIVVFATTNEKLKVIESDTPERFMRSDEHGTQIYWKTK